jgi:SAM-dependent methyltransferase
MILKFQNLFRIYFEKIERGYFLRNNFIYKNYLRLIERFKFSPLRPKSIPWQNTTLKTRRDVMLAINYVKELNLNYMKANIEKNWDSLITLDTILRNTNNSSRILDAGGKKNSLILHWLYQYGYNNLYCINLLFKRKIRRGNITFLPGDLTKTEFPDNYFDVITCISVMEHGVNLEKYFMEMNRILKKGGLLITSTDYWEDKINTNNIYIYDNPVFIFDKDSIIKLLEIADNSGFELFGSEVDLRCKEKAVYWKRFDLNFTFLIFCLKKSN